MNARSAAEVCELLTTHAIDYCLQGGWGVDALLGKPSRPHKDLDLLIRIEDVALAMRLMDEHGFRLKYTWPESRWVDESGDRVPTAFVVAHEDGREVDFHAARWADDGGAVGASENDRAFGPKDLAGVGEIGGVKVRCYSVQMQFRAHEEYDLPEEHAHDLELLATAFGIVHESSAGGTDGGP